MERGEREMMRLRGGRGWNKKPGGGESPLCSPSFLSLSPGLRRVEVDALHPVGPLGEAAVWWGVGGEGKMEEGVRDEGICRREGGWRGEGRREGRRDEG